jgi:RNA recognition motif-containing protein
MYAAKKDAETMQDFSQKVNNNKLYIGNLPWSVTSEQLADMFGQFGEIVEDGAIVITDRMSGRSKGFGFVEFTEEEAAKAALEAMNETEIEGRSISVTIARPKAPRENRGGFNRGGNRGGYGRNNDRRGGDRGGYNRRG